MTFNQKVRFSDTLKAIKVSKTFLIELLLLTSILLLITITVIPKIFYKPKQNDAIIQ